ncbi:hypothetical protein Fmac_010627 [Flemingia macrophylla]|uniref:Uncharacterized protein n=1 Tax=Flemingia macrophylla TaxID=520843 RepID=A0ABD1MKE0_9FABA
MAEPVGLNRASSCESVNNYASNLAPVYAIDSQKAVSDPINKCPELPIDLNKSPPPDSSNDENEFVLVFDEGDFAASGIGKSERPNGGVEDCSSFWVNKKKNFLKWLSATANIFKKKKNERAD